jgi:hypothetical protein
MPIGPRLMEVGRRWDLAMVALLHWAEPQGATLQDDGVSRDSGSTMDAHPARVALQAAPRIRTELGYSATASLSLVEAIPC